MHDEILEEIEDSEHDLYWNFQLSTQAKSADELFEEFESNKDGKISEDELKAQLVALGLCTPESLTEFMHALDTDMDGTLSREEFSLFISTARDMLFPQPVDPRKKLTYTNNEVFLGGSCNPTTWRTDIVIPILQHNEVSFYNPQVDDWHQGLISLEAQAKLDALVLLFVIDSTTRALSSMIEVAELITGQRDVILVIQDVKEGQEIGDASVGKGEAKDLNRCRAYLADLAKRLGRTAETALVYTNIVTATSAVIRLVNRKREEAWKAGIEVPALMKKGKSFHVGDGEDKPQPNGMRKRLNTVS